MRLQIEYLDHNEAFAHLLPRSGTAVREFRDTHGAERWVLVDLDDPLEWQLKEGEPFQFRLMRVNAFLIRSRWQKCDIGDPEGVSVFVLLVEEGHHPTGSVIDPKDYVHIAWGMCRILQAG